jgi:hypothetical protein
MDANKLERLKEIGYSIQPTCGLCVHFFAPSGGEFGECDLYSYEHLKHSGPPRKLSVHRNGGCADGFRLSMYSYTSIVDWPRSAIPRTEG